jgi:hypothetical protein
MDFLVNRKNQDLGNIFILTRGGQPAAHGSHAAQINISAAQNRIENQRFFDILGVFSQFFVIMWPKKSISLANFSSCDPETNLGWPPLILTELFTLKELRLEKITCKIFSGT